MKTIKPLLVTSSLLMGLLYSTVTLAAFTSGSDGSLGALNVTEDTLLTMPADGKFHYTTITVAEGATLTFTPNSANTPVYLLATGDVNIQGTIDVSGKKGQLAIGGAGGPGGFGGGRSGNPSIAGAQPGAGYGPGAGLAATGSYGGDGAYSSRGYSGWSGSALLGDTYGSQLLVPMLGGSGGGGSNETNGGGGGGGGAILIASTTLINIATTGRVGAMGGEGYSSPYAGDGSGGAIRLVAPDVTGDGNLDVRGAYSSYGFGRARVDMYIKPSTSFSLVCTGSSFPSNTCTTGSFMKVFLDNIPTLEVTEVAGIAITGDDQYIELPFNAAASQNIVIKSTNFASDVNVRIRLTSVAGNSVTEDVTITKEIGKDTQTNTFSLNFPLNTAVRVNAWTIP